MFKSRCVFVAQCCWQKRRRVLFSTYLGCLGQGRICVIYVMTSAARIGQRESVSSDTWMKIVIARVRRNDFDDISVFNPKITRRKYGSRCFLSRVPRRIESKSGGDFSTSHPKTSPKLLSGSGRMWWKLGGSPPLSWLGYECRDCLCWCESFLFRPVNDQSVFGQTFLERNKHH